MEVSTPNRTVGVNEQQTLKSENEAKMTAGSKLFVVDVYVTNATQAEMTGREKAAA
jgi:hypothetical protein